MEMDKAECSELPSLLCGWRYLGLGFLGSFVRLGEFEFSRVRTEQFVFEAMAFELSCADGVCGKELDLSRVKNACSPKPCVSLVFLF